MADLLRGDYKQSEYGRVILPLTVIRRLDCVLERTERDCAYPTPNRAAGKLHGLRRSGVLSESEFNMKKWDVLSRS